MPSAEISEQYLNISLEHVSTDFYEYMLLVDFQTVTAEDVIFYQSVQVFNNIENGFGIIGSTTASLDSVLIYGREVDVENARKFEK